MTNIEVEAITPDKAHEYLGYNTHNRNLRARVIEGYAADMRSGDWLWNGESIKFAADGALLDGQHRLAAIIEAGVTVQMAVVRGLANRAQETVDGGAKRTFADVLHLRGETHYVTLATTVRGICQWENGQKNFGSGGPYTNAQLLATLQKYPWVREGMTQVGHVTRTAGLPARVGGPAWWLFVQIDLEDAAHFFDRLSSDQDHHAGDPIYMLRKAIADALKVKGQPSVGFLLAITIKAWNKYRDGETVGLLNFRAGGARPEKFPEPH